MTEKNNPHARRVTVSRVGEQKTNPADSPASGRKVVAVRLKGDREQPRAVNVLPEATAEPSADMAAVPVPDCRPETDTISPADLPHESADRDEGVDTAETDSTEQRSDATEITASDHAEAAVDVPSDAIEPPSAESELPVSADMDNSPAADTASTSPTDEEPVCEDVHCAQAAPADSTDEKSAPEKDDEEPGQTSETEAACERLKETEAVIDTSGIIDNPAAFFEVDIGETISPSSKWYIPQRWADIDLPRKIIMILSVALFLFSCLPLLVGVLSPGILPPAMIAAFFFLCALYWPLIDGCESTWGNVLIGVVAVCVLAGVTYLSFVSGKMISASANTLREDRSDVTVVVLGCKINGDRPSRMLHARLETAAEFLLEHPQSHCIVTGGQGEDEDYPEALIMKNYLVDKGVSPMRIVMETQSTSTLENITFSARMAEQYNCHERFLIVTDRFHQYRAMRTANDLGIVSYALNVETAWYLAMPYWFREMVAITRDWVTA